MWHRTERPSLGFPKIFVPASICCCFVLSRHHLCWQDGRQQPLGQHAVCSCSARARKPVFHPQDERIFLQSNWTNLGFTSLPGPMTVTREMPSADWIPKYNTGKRFIYNAGSTNQDPGWSQDQSRDLGVIWLEWRRKEELDAGQTLYCV